MVMMTEDTEDGISPARTAPTTTYHPAETEIEETGTNPASVMAEELYHVSESVGNDGDGDEREDPDANESHECMMSLMQVNSNSVQSQF